MKQIIEEGLATNDFHLSGPPEKDGYLTKPSEFYKEKNRMREYYTLKKKQDPKYFLNDPLKDDNDNLKRAKFELRYFAMKVPEIQDVVWDYTWNQSRELTAEEFHMSTALSS